MSKAFKIVIILQILCLLTACMSGDSLTINKVQDEKRTIDGPDNIQLHVLTNRVDLVDNGGLQHYANMFQEQYPNVDIRFEGLTNYVSDITARLSTQNYGDVLLIPNDLKNEALQNYFEPLPEDIFSNLRFADHKAFDGKYYGIATGASATGIVYNKRAFELAGIVKIPETLDEFLLACEQLKKAGITPIYLNYGAEWPLMNWGEELVSVMNGDANFLNNMVHVDAPWQEDNEWGKVISIVKYLIEHNYVEENLLSNQWETSKSEFVAGNVGMFMLGNWVISQLISLGAAPEDIGFFPFPYRNEKPIYSLLNPDWFIAVSKHSKNKEMAIAWINFFVKESGYIDDSGFLPVEINEEPKLPQYQEFLTYGSIPVERKIASDELLELAALANIRLWSGVFTQEWIAADNLQETLDGYNARWAEAKQLLEH